MLSSAKPRSTGYLWTIQIEWFSSLFWGGELPSPFIGYNENLIGPLDGHFVQYQRPLSLLLLLPFSFFWSLEKNKSNSWSWWLLFLSSFNQACFPSILLNPNLPLVSEVRFDESRSSFKLQNLFRWNQQKTACLLGEELEGRRKSRSPLIQLSRRKGNLPQADKGWN